MQRKEASLKAAHMHLRFGFICSKHFCLWIKRYGWHGIAGNTGFLIYKTRVIRLLIGTQVFFSIRKTVLNPKPWTCDLTTDFLLIQWLREATANNGQISNSKMHVDSGHHTTSYWKTPNRMLCMARTSRAHFTLSLTIACCICCTPVSEFHRITAT